MDQQTATPKQPTDQAITPVQQQKPQSPNNSFLNQVRSLSTPVKIVAALAIFFLLIFIVTFILFLSGNASDKSGSNSTSTKTDAVEKERTRQIAAREAALAAKEPVNQLETAYDLSVGSDSSKRSLTLDSSGTALIEYEIASKDGQVILKTSFENFADLANRVFNIPTITRLNVTTYANKFTDSFGKPNVFAVKLQLTKETNAKINWSVKKYAYGDYATILDHQEINPDLTKDYKSLIRNN